MIHYTDTDNNDTLPAVRWNENRFSIPILDESTNTTDQPG